MGSTTHTESLKFGLIGASLQHSFSKDFFTKKFQESGLQNHVYQNIELKNTTELEHFLKNEALHFKGLNVTIPYKEAVIPFLDEIDEDAQKIGAVNVIAIKDQKLIGFNTDCIGFKDSLTPLLKKHHQKALILGTGGASKAVAFVCNQLQIPFYRISRSPKNDQTLPYKDLTQALFETHHILINTTPLGTFPNVDGKPDIPYHFITNQHLVYDLIYNPVETVFLKKARLQGATTQNGYKMLVLQAEKAWEIWSRF